MKTITKLFAFAVVILGFSATSFGQATGTASSAATIITPISIDKDVDMNFGNIAVQAGTGGTVVLTPAGSRSGTLGVTVSNAIGGTVTAASFIVKGVANYNYSISFPNSSCIVSDGTNFMTVNAFTSTPTPSGNLGSGGQQILSIGATLNVTAGQVAGVYNSTNAGGTLFSVTVNYN